MLNDLLIPYRALFVGFSGGLDSTVLLHQLRNNPLLSQRITAVHVHHGLSSEATRWQQHCQGLCDAWQVPLIIRHVTIQAKSNIEEAARIARYKMFESLITSEKDALVLAHHEDDQAETVLLHLMRGAGIEGLSAISVSSVLSKGMLIRPLLEVPKQSLLQYARHNNLSWIEDESNQEEAFSRNFLRHRIIPLLQEKWPSVVQNVARTATHCQQAKKNLEVLAELDYPGLETDQLGLSLPKLRALQFARLSNVLRVWLQKNKVRAVSKKRLDLLIQEVILARTDAMPCFKLGNRVIRRYQDKLYLLHDFLKVAPMEWVDFPQALVMRAGTLEATPSTEGLLVPALSRIQVRYRQGGEQFVWHGQTKHLKTLMQHWHIPPWQRSQIPLLYINDTLAAVLGYAISDLFYAQKETPECFNLKHTLISC